MSIKVTSNALKELTKIKEEQKLPEGTFVRVAVEGGGCAGFQYKLNFEEEDGFDKTKDTMTEHDGIKIVVDKKSDLFIDGTTLDFYTDLTKRGFTFDNPNAAKGCGCGKSFQA